VIIPSPLVLFAPIDESATTRGGAAPVRIGELGSPPELISLLLGALTWAGLYARDARVRALVPLIR
jgi:hypothetical protein